MLAPQKIARNQVQAQAIAAWEDLPSEQWFFSNGTQDEYNIG